MSENKENICQECLNKRYIHFWQFTGKDPIASADKIHGHTMFKNGRCIGIPCCLCNEEKRCIILYTGSDFKEDRVERNWRLYR